jgi:hypothetical protein
VHGNRDENEYDENINCTPAVLASQVKTQCQRGKYIYKCKAAFLKTVNIIFDKCKTADSESMNSGFWSLGDILVPFKRRCRRNEIENNIHASPKINFS